MVITFIRYVGYTYQRPVYLYVCIMSSMYITRIYVSVYFKCDVLYMSVQIVIICGEYILYSMYSEAFIITLKSPGDVDND